MTVHIIVADSTCVSYAPQISEMISRSAMERGLGLAVRTPEYIAAKIEEEKAVIALAGDRPVGFAYIETWSHRAFVANSGLIVDPDYRHMKIAGKIKRKIFQLSREKYPESKIFSLTTGLAVMKMNSRLGFRPVTFSELTQDAEFWQGCEGCNYYDILVRNKRKLCLCTGLLYDPSEHRCKQKRTAEKQSVEPSVSAGSIINKTTYNEKSSTCL